MFQNGVVLLKVYKRVILLLMLVLSQYTVAQDNCVRGVTEYNICDDAKNLASEIAKMLPMDMSQNMSFESVAPILNTIQAHIRLRYTKELMEESYQQAGISIEQGTQALETSARGVCADGTATRAFINLGGVIVYVYSFIDGEQFMNVEVKRCD